MVGCFSGKESLILNQAAQALKIFLADPRITALEITEFDATQDPRGVYAQKFAVGVFLFLYSCSELAA